MPSSRRFSNCAAIIAVVSAASVVFGGITVNCAFGASTEQSSEEDLVDQVLKWNEQAQSLSAQGKYSEAEQLLFETLRKCEKKLGVNDKFTGMTRVNLSNLYQATNQTAKSEELLTVFVNRKKPDDDVLDSTSVCELASIYQRQGRLPEAEKLLRSALEHNEAVLGKRNHPDVAFLFQSLAHVLIAQGKTAESEKAQQRAVDAFKKTHGLDHAFTTMAIQALARNYITAKKFEQARGVLTPVITELQLGGGGERTKAAAEMLLLIALSFQAEQDFPRATQAYNVALSETEKAFSPSDRQTAEVLVAMASMYRDERKFDQSIKYIDQALAISSKLPSDRGGRVVDRELQYLGEVYLLIGQWENAIAAYERWIPVLENMLPAKDPLILRALNRQATLLRDLREKDKLQAVETKIKSLTPATK